MDKKSAGVIVLVILGVYFAFFHTAPFPLNHEAIGLPPLHTLHAVFGVALLGMAGYIWMKK